jgi:hypothetical protein
MASQLASNAMSARMPQTKRQAKTRTQRARGFNAEDRIVGEDSMDRGPLVGPESVAF